MCAIHFNGEQRKVKLRFNIVIRNCILTTTYEDDFEPQVSYTVAEFLIGEKRIYSGAGKTGLPYSPRRLARLDSTDTEARLPSSGMTTVIP